MQILFILSIISALIDWAAVAKRNKKAEAIAKPATMVFLIGGYLYALPSSPPIFAYVFSLGLVLSLIGDVLLMMPDKYFIRGVVAFLLAQVAYVISFASSGTVLNLPSLAVGAVILAATILLLRPIIAELRSSGQRSLVLPIYAYSVPLALMLWFCTNTLFRPGWPALAGLLAAGGGLLFYISDVLNVWQRFVSEIPGNHLPVMITYHLGQFALSGGMLIFVNSVA